MSVIRMEINETPNRRDGSGLRLRFHPRKIEISVDDFNDIEEPLTVEDLEKARHFLNKCESALNLRDEFNRLTK
jgi:hypothetical protein